MRGNWKPWAGAAFLAVTVIVTTMVASPRRQQDRAKSQIYPAVGATVDQAQDHASQAATSPVTYIQLRGFQIMQFEAPSVLGQWPTTNVTLDDATSWCNLHDARLCTDEEWTMACDHIDARKLDFCRGLLEGQARLLPSGKVSACYTQDNGADFVGNAWEWVQSADPHVVALKGGSYLEAGDTERSCRYTLQLLRPQMSQLSMHNVGFRCCRDVEPK